MSPRAKKKHVGRKSGPSYRKRKLEQARNARDGISNVSRDAATATKVRKKEHAEKLQAARDLKEHKGLGGRTSSTKYQTLSVPPSPPTPIDHRPHSATRPRSKSAPPSSRNHAPSDVHTGLSPSQLNQLDSWIQENRDVKGQAPLTISRMMRHILAEFGVSLGEQKVAAIIKAMHWEFVDPGKKGYVISRGNKISTKQVRQSSSFYTLSICIPTHLQPPCIYTAFVMHILLFLSHLSSHFSPFPFLFFLCIPNPISNFFPFLLLSFSYTVIHSSSIPSFHASSSTFPPSSMSSPSFSCDLFFPLPFSPPSFFSPPLLLALPPFLPLPPCP